MRDGSPSATARRVAAYRLSFERLATPFGVPSADDALARDVGGAEADVAGARADVGGAEADVAGARADTANGAQADVDVDVVRASADTAAGDSERMARYLRLRTAFFDRVVVNALERDVCQVASIGAGYDGRALRYAKPGVRWFEVDHRDTQRDKLARLDRLGIETPGIVFLPHDLRDAGLAAALTAAGFEPDAPSLLLCEGVAVYLEEAVFAALLAELRAVAAAGTRFALSSRARGASADPARRERFNTVVAALGEPALGSLSADGLSALLTAARWRATDISERSQRAGFALAAPA